MDESIPKNQNKKWSKRLIIIIAVIFFIALSLGGLFNYPYLQSYAHGFAPGLKIADYAMVGKTVSQATAILQEASQRIINHGLVFTYLDKNSGENKTMVVAPMVFSPTDPDLTQAILSFNIDKTVNQAYRIGRGGTFWGNLKIRLAVLFYGENIPLDFSLDQEDLVKILQDHFSPLENPAQNAKLVITPLGDDFTIGVASEKVGKKFDYQAAVRAVERNLSYLDNTPVSISLIDDYPVIRKDNTASAAAIAQSIIDNGPLELQYQDYRWTIDREKIISWLELQAQDAKGQTITLGLNKEGAMEYLKNIAESINVEARDTKLKIIDGRAVEFQASQDGLTVDVEASYQEVNNKIIQKEKTAVLAVKVTKVEAPADSVNNLGIKELIGLGESKFAGSPVNRRHNIQVGVDKLNGLLIGPGEEFSLVKALGPVNAGTGYLPELVIKGNKTTAEYGGGLCQIATTVFRAALYSGLPITERNPHAYRVFYFEPAGMDATIYMPHPDLRFINNTGNYILIQAKSKGDDLTFEFWGASDGRKVDITKPRIYNFVPPQPTLMVETEDLAPGKQKCIEIAHTGAETEFFRTISSASGDVKTESWKSKYQPWRAVCMIGKQPAVVATADVTSSPR